MLFCLSEGAKCLTTRTDKLNRVNPIDRNRCLARDHFTACMHGFTPPAQKNKAKKFYVGQTSVYLHSLFRAHFTLVSKNFLPLIQREKLASPNKQTKQTVFSHLHIYLQLDCCCSFRFQISFVSSSFLSFSQKQ